MTPRNQVAFRLKLRSSIQQAYGPWSWSSQAAVQRVTRTRQLATLAKLPILIIFGDYLDAPTGIPNFSWQTSLEGCKEFIARVNTAGGQAQIMHLPDQGIRGNSHMIMQDRNNLQIADTILKWIDEKTGKK